MDLLPMQYPSSTNYINRKPLSGMQIRVRRPNDRSKMATDEKQPLLLGDEEEDDFDSPRAQLRDLIRSDPSRSGKCLYQSSGGGSVDVSTSASLQNIHLQEADHIVAIFVVAFDTKAGNMIEWCLPEDIDLEGVEFKAMSSGSHTQLNDFVYIGFVPNRRQAITRTNDGPGSCDKYMYMSMATRLLGYFRKGNMYGLACFENMPVESEIERGARMKSVGILATSYTLLYRHMQFLETQVRHQLEVPGRYQQLQAFYEDKKATLEGIPASMSTNSLASTPGSELLPEMKITHPAGCFAQFINFFGVRIFTLWKYVLLQKRILFFSPPPIGVVCYRVYCGCCLGAHTLGSQLTEREIKPQFYVNIADIDMLETEMSYIACTTEKIFESKSHLYDVYVDNQNVTTPSQILRDILKVSDGDRDKLQKLNNQRSALMYEAEEVGEHIDEEEIFTYFFREQNNRLFQVLLDVSQSADRQLTSEHMNNMGLDPVGDRAFLMELVETYGIDVMLLVDNPCCPR